LPRSTSEQVLNALTSAIMDELSEGGAVTLIGFGSFTVTKRGSRLGSDPRTGERIEIQGKNYPKFSAGLALKQEVNAD